MTGVIPRWVSVPTNRSASYALSPIKGIWVGVLDQRLRASQIMSLAWREHQLDGIAQGVDERVNFGGQSAARSADRLWAVFFAPRRCADGHAQWWRRSSCIRCR